MRTGGCGRQRERGVTLVMMALMLFLALGMSALVVDFGMIKASNGTFPGTRTLTMHFYTISGSVVIIGNVT